jgi:hypothetical protein
MLLITLNCIKDQNLPLICVMNVSGLSIVGYELRYVKVWGLPFLKTLDICLLHSLFVSDGGLYVLSNSFMF